MTDQIEQNRKIYLDALRSGNYTQAFGKYYHKNKNINGTETMCYCALGILGNLFYATNLTALNDYTTIQLLGIEQEIIAKIVRWNDTDRLTFKEITDRLDNIWKEKTE